MAAQFIVPQSTAMPPRKLWTREECAVLVSSGLIDGQRFEMIEGNLIHKPSKEPAYSRAVQIMAIWLREVFGEDFAIQYPSFHLRPEDDVWSEPEPAVIVLTRSFRDFSDLPHAHDIRLVVEVSTPRTYAFDRSTKARLYARAGIVDYWVLHLEGRRMIVHRDPAGDGYRSVLAYGEHEFVTTLAAPSNEVRVGEFLK